MMGMEVVVDMSGFIRTTVELGNKLVVILMEKLRVTKQDSQLVSPRMALLLRSVRLTMMVLRMQVVMSGFISTAEGVGIS